MQTEALLRNLERTAVDVAIPSEFEVLLEISEPLYGVYHDTERLLKEIHHTYVGWVDTVPELHRRAMNDVYHYNAHDRGAEGFSAYGDLYHKAATEAVPKSLRADATRWWLAYLRKVVAESDDRLDRNLDAVARSLGHLAEIFADAPTLAATSSPGLKQLVTRLGDSNAAGIAAVTAQAEGLFRSVLDQVYELWLARDDPADWYRALDPQGEGLPAAVELISHGVLANTRKRLAASAASLTPISGADLLAYPDHAAITRGYFDAAEELDGAVDARTRWLCRVLGEQLLTPIHERALWSLARFCSTLVVRADKEQFERFIAEVFAALRAAGTSFGAAHLDLVRRIGVAVLDSPQQSWADIVVDEILSLPFHRPDFVGYTDDWSVLVNPNHLRNIRTYLAIVGANPAASGRLLAALVIHLDMGGVFLADTDLFQKDVSALLASDVGPVYHQVRSLLRRLPVYFSDIGAEGELRDVSTRIDENRARRDPICHFLRKQCHVESNPGLITLVEKVGQFWASGDRDALLAYLPDEMHSSLDINSPMYQGLHEIFRILALRDGGLIGLFEGPIDDVDAALDDLRGMDPVDIDKAALLFRLRNELARKYALDHADLIPRLHAVTRLDQTAITDLENELDGGDLEAALGRLLGLLEELQQIVLSSGPTSAVEDIYRKRHIGTGIPSMYGSYREDRVDAIGLSFRIESLVGALFDEVVAQDPVESLDRRTIYRVAGWMRLLARAVEIEGYRSQSLNTNLSMLDDALALPVLTEGELIDVFRGITQSVHGIVRGRVLQVYGDLFEALGPQMVARGEIDVVEGNESEAVLRASETFLRDLIAESLGLQRLDNLAGNVLHALNDPARTWVGRNRGPSGEPVKVVPISGAFGKPGPLHLGNKGAILGRLADFGFPIPRGFIIPTDLARSRADDAGSAETLPSSLVDQVRAEMLTLETDSGARFGDPNRPLLLSVRSGAPISMPGMLHSFLNVGINPEIVEGLARTYGRPWAAWDAYRRFLQFWGMSRGLDRDLFDGLMSGAKKRFSVAKKALLTPEQMQELAFDYRHLLIDKRVEVIDDPDEQLFACVELVLASWDSAMARVYRGEVGIAEAWRSAVIVQTMVYGNLHRRSGTGVLLTKHPQRRSDSFELFGDFVIQGQGDDVVSGLVDTFPISQRQRAEEPTDAGGSLEHDFPEIYDTLDRLGRSLVEEHGWAHQEIEFTFEGDRPEDLFILQAREAVADESSDLPTFRLTADLAGARLAVGIGVSGGAFSARVAQDAADITTLRFEYPGDPVLLVRPDTVPDDIHLLLQADALLTAIGGATSHAAVVAKRLGKTCVVGCRELRVYETEGRSEIAGHRLDRGDWVSISGRDGSVYVGRHEVETGEAAGWLSARIGVSE